MKKITLLLLTILPFFIACDSTNSDEADDNTFSVVVTNGLAVSIDIFTNVSSHESFTNHGTVRADSQVTISDMEIGVTYVLTATEVDGSLDNWYYQTEFINRDNSDLELTVEPIF